MTSGFYSLPGDLFLGSNRASALEQGPRKFTSIRKAVCFAVEQAAPVSLRGAELRVGGRCFGPEAITRLYRELVGRRG